MISVRSVSVRFGGVVPIYDASLDMDVGVNGLIGPNGAGKTTFLNVLSGFATPASGSVTAFGEDLLRLPHFKRVRWGLRRTFQTEQAIAELTVFENVLTVLEHSGGSPSTQRRDVADAVEFVGLGALHNQRVGSLGAAERRLVELARAVVGSPRVVLLDEPAAGLPDEETAALGDVIAQIPERTGALTIMVDHDMDLVGRCCSNLAVLDFGEFIANGPTAEVLNDQRVMAAYLGDQDLDLDRDDKPAGRE